MGAGAGAGGFECDGCAGSVDGAAGCGWEGVGRRRAGAGGGEVGDADAIGGGAADGPGAAEAAWADATTDAEGASTALATDGALASGATDA